MLKKIFSQFWRLKSFIPWWRSIAWMLWRVAIFLCNIRRSGGFVLVARIDSQCQSCHQSEIQSGRETLNKNEIYKFAFSMFKTWIIQTICKISELNKYHSLSNDTNYIEVRHLWRWLSSENHNFVTWKNIMATSFTRCDLFLATKNMALATKKIFQ